MAIGVMTIIRYFENDLEENERQAVESALAGDAEAQEQLEMLRQSADALGQAFGHLRDAAPPSPTDNVQTANSHRAEHPHLRSDVVSASVPVEDGSGLHYYIDLLRRQYFVPAGVFGLVLAAFAAFAILLPPVFRSEAKILAESQQIPADLVRSTVTSLADDRLQVIKQRVTNPQELLDIADRIQLLAEERGKLSRTGFVELLRQRISIEPFNPGAAVGRRAREGALTKVFTVGFEDRDPQVAAKAAKELVTLILNEDVRARTSRATESAQFLRREVERQQKELVTIEVQIANFELGNKDALPDKQPFLMSALERAEKDLALLDREVQGMEEEKGLLEFDYSVKKEGGGKTTEGSDLANTAVSLEALKAKLYASSAVMSADHPEIKALKQQIAALEKQLKSPDAAAAPEKLVPEDMAKLDLGTRVAAEKIVTVERRRQLLLAQRANLARNIEGLKGLIARIPEVQKGLSRLERQRDVLQKSLDELSFKLMQARLGENLEQDQQAERFEVIEQPVTPTTPVRPNRKKIIVLGLALAMAAAAISVLGLGPLGLSIRSHLSRQ